MFLICNNRHIRSAGSFHTLPPSSTVFDMTVQDHPGSRNKPTEPGNRCQGYGTVQVRAVPNGPLFLLKMRHHENQWKNYGRCAGWFK
jgi:hypothetical protein